MEKVKKFLDNMLSILIYTIVFVVFIGIANPPITTREVIGYALILGFFAGMINNIERVIRELFKKKEE